jgi:uncharacterized protein (DUF433 family)
MPYSDLESKPWTITQATWLAPETILDVGAGAGVYAEMLKPLLPDTHITAYEAWEPYIYQFQLLKKYDAVSLGDVREALHFNYDLVILGDIVEHMPEADAKALWHFISKEAKAAIISIPIIHYPQGAENGNPYEIHVEEDWNTERILEAFPGITNYKEFPIVGVYVAEFR